MRVHIVSDVHDEFHQTRLLLPVDKGELNDPDFIVSGGDIYRGSSVAHEDRWRRKNNCPVIKISGNHEHYKIERTVQENIADLRLAASQANAEAPELPGLHFLENESVTLRSSEGELVKFIGATLWTDFRLYEGEGIDRQTAMKEVSRTINDYSLCSGERDAHGITKKLRPAQALKWHEESVEYIVSELHKPFEGIRVVVTHTSPVPGCLNPEFQKTLEDRKSATAFGSDLSWICEDDELAPDLWISGHGHNSFDFEVGRTRHIGNPMGYPRRSGGAENRAFNARLIVTTEMLPRFRPGEAKP